MLLDWHCHLITPFVNENVEILNVFLMNTYNLIKQGAQMS